MASAAVEMPVPHFSEENAEDLSYAELDTFPDFLLPRAQEISSLHLDHNQITILPRCIGDFQNLVSLDISDNQMSYMSKEIVTLQHLKTLNARNNLLDNENLPKEFGKLQTLEHLNLSGNSFEHFPMQVTELRNLKCLYFGANFLTTLPSEIGNLQRLEVVFLGGNRLTELPSEMGYLTRIRSLNLCDNQLQSLPSTLVNLRRLESLSLHSNQLSTLPPEIVALDLVELSLRNNPLVVKFVQDMIFEPPTLQEMAGRVVKINNVGFTSKDLPRHLISYLEKAQQCVNPKCKGVYFTSCVEVVKFVDFCGKYRLPLLQYLCSPHCTTASPTVVGASSESDSDEDSPVNKMKRVLLG